MRLGRCLPDARSLIVLEPFFRRALAWRRPVAYMGAPVMLLEELRLAAQLGSAGLKKACHAQN